MESVAARLGPVLQVGEDHVEREGRRRGEREERGEVEGVDGEGERRRRRQGRSVLWDEDYQEPEDGIPQRERRLTSYF